MRCADASILNNYYDYLLELERFVVCDAVRFDSVSRPFDVTNYLSWDDFASQHFSMVIIERELSGKGTFFFLQRNSFL